MIILALLWSMKSVYISAFLSHQIVLNISVTQFIIFFTNENERAFGKAIFIF